MSAREKRLTTEDLAEDMELHVGYCMDDDCYECTLVRDLVDARAALAEFPSPDLIEDALVRLLNDPGCWQRVMLAYKKADLMRHAAVNDPVAQHLGSPIDKR